MTDIIFLFGHRKGRGKDYSCDLMEEGLRKRSKTYMRTFFAKKLKKHCAERYNLDFDKMDLEDYKNSKPEHLNGLTVRDVLLKEGNFARSIWSNVWVSAAYNEILDGCHKVGLLSDYRFPNEYIAFPEIYKTWKEKWPHPPYWHPERVPKLVKVHVERKSGKYVNDGADDQLPDDREFWDEVINNDVEGPGWEENLHNQVENLLKKYIDNKQGIMTNDLSLHKTQ
jgi:hypothetical protein